MGKNWHFNVGAAQATHEGAGGVDNARWGNMGEKHVANNKKATEWSLFHRQVGV